MELTQLEFYGNLSYRQFKDLFNHLWKFIRNNKTFSIFQNLIFVFLQDSNVQYILCLPSLFANLTNNLLNFLLKYLDSLMKLLNFFLRNVYNTFDFIFIYIFCAYWPLHFDITKYKIIIYFKRWLLIRLNFIIHEHCILIIWIEIAINKWILHFAN